jgi:hypothetical protein
MQPFFTLVKPGGGSHRMYLHDGEEFGFATRGNLTLVLDKERLGQVSVSTSPPTSPMTVRTTAWRTQRSFGLSRRLHFT